MVVVYRQIVTPTGRKVTISANGQEAVELPNQAFAGIKVKPGHVVVRSDWPWGAGNPSGVDNIDAQAGQYYYFEIVANTSGADPIISMMHVVMEGKGLIPEEAAQATESLTHCCRVIPVEDDYAPADYVPPTN